MSPSTGSLLESYAAQANWREPGDPRNKVGFHAFLVEAYRGGDRNIPLDEFLATLRSREGDPLTDDLASRKKRLAAKMFLHAQYEDAMVLLARVGVETRGDDPGPQGRIAEPDPEVASAARFFIREIDALDNFSAHAITLWGKHFPTAEHAFQWKKFSLSSPDIAETILAAPSPWMAQSTARAHRGDRPPDWHDTRVEIMREVLIAKVSQHDDVRDTLRRTGPRVIIEDSPTDAFWGIGPDGTGQNVMGKLWMEIRETLSDPRDR
jgi:hypothetical protein